MSICAAHCSWVCCSNGKEQGVQDAFSTNGKATQISDKKLYNVNASDVSSATCKESGNNYVSVSYTHLDVYKRQSKRRISERGNLLNEEEPDQAFGAHDGAGARVLHYRRRRLQGRRRAPAPS